MILLLLCCPVSVPHTAGGKAAALDANGLVTVRESPITPPHPPTTAVSSESIAVLKSRRIWQMSK